MSQSPGEMETPQSAEAAPWYKEVTPYMWVVLIIASLGWIFDIFEGQIFVASMNEAMPSLLSDDPALSAKAWNNIAFGFFLLGGMVGGLLFGKLSDRFGRIRALTISILMYAVFSGLTAFVQSPEQMVAMRFLVAIGLGGEWAVAAAMVAEVMPERARARLSGVFHASSVLGTFLAVLAGIYIIGNSDLRIESMPSLNWRLGFALGVVPALLIVWIRLSLREPESWVKARDRAQADQTQQTGRIGELFSQPLWRRTVLGLALATIGLATFWGVHVYGKDLLRGTVERPYAAQLPDYLTDQRGDGPPELAQPVLGGEVEKILEQRMAQQLSREEKLTRLQQDLAPFEKAATKAPRNMSKTAWAESVLDAKFESIKYWEMIGLFLTTVGGGLGLVSFGPICERIGRRRAFLFYHLGALAAALALFMAIPRSNSQLFYCLTLPVFGFVTLGMHAGYAIYFPELFPTRLRGTGGGFCFNVARALAAPILFLSGWMQEWWHFTLGESVSILSSLYLVGMIITLLAPETKGQKLPE